MNKQKVIAIIFVIVIITCTVFIFSMIFFSPAQRAKGIIDDFYQYEQEGMFAKSWDLFHSEMKRKFDKSDYLQDRPHVFMNHFGVTTFSFVLSDVDKLSNWKVEKDAKPLTTVYKVAVTQTYKGKYGNFQLTQEVFATKEEGDWKVLWNYNK
ncbi:hypothetical protein [Aquibacillus saliphilus]|uniref:hypothetical protein n=1 Tax=Aquibacillus saliphilus TaxID=1909422 RepID=UPI001CF00B87|nr:hypothetical protein [Aquibacillus saliphilus]